MLRWIVMLLVVMLSTALAAPGKIVGTVRDARSNSPLAGANVLLVELHRGTVSDAEGRFEFPAIPKGSYTLKVSYLGYRDHQAVVTVSEEETPLEVNVALEPTPLLGKEVTVVATRAREGETPVAFSTLTREDIGVRYYAQDLPVLLSELPSTTFYSESGHGLGYNYLSIRGFNQRRISVMINGVPQNDPEDHNVYWVDFPDFLSNVEDIQVQRGAGSAFYGPPAIGGSINIITSSFSPERRISAFTGFGSYDTRRYSVSFNSGLLRDHWVISGRASQILSDGYRERSWLDFKSFFLGIAHFTRNTSTRVHFYGGPIEDHLAFYGISKEEALNRSTRRRNPITGPDEIENFNQPHLELINTWRINDRLTLNNTLFYIRGYGFFDYDGSWAPFSYFRLTPEYGFDVQGDPDTLFASRVLIRAYVDNKQGGWFPNLTWQHAWGQTVIGGEFRIHRSLHWGRIQKGSSDLPPAISGPYQGLSYIGKRRYYEYKGAKDIFSPYVQNIFRLTQRIKWHLALQFVHQRYRLYDEKFIGTDFEVPYNFLNPRIGFNITLDPRVNFFVSYSRTTREPRLKTLYDAAEASTPASWGAVVPQFRQNPDGTLDFDNPLVKPEKLNDIEVGLGYRTDGFSGDVNFYYMDFRDEIVKKGQLDRFGQPITGNADRTLHTGVEISARARLLSGLTFTGNMTLSRNVLKRYTVYDSEGVGHVLDGNPIAGFPGFLANARLTYRRHGLIASVVMQHVGKQYTDNFANEAHTVDPYTVFHGTVGYNLGRWLPVKEFILQLHIQNIFDTLYITHGEGEEFFPAAERHFFVNAKLSL